MSHVLAKSDFLDFLICSKSLWLRKHKPDAIEWPSPSAFVRMLMKDGYEIETLMKQLVSTWPDKESYGWQIEFCTKDGLLARTDLIKENGEKNIDLYEIKSSSSLVGSNGEDYLVDATYQTIVAQRAGYTVNRTYIVHLNKEFVKKDDIELNQILQIVDVSEEVKKRTPDIEETIDRALVKLSRTKIDESNCSCLYKSRANHCAAFSYFNPHIASPSIYDLPRISATRLKTFVEENRLKLKDIDASEVNLVKILSTTSNSLNKETDANARATRMVHNLMTLNAEVVTACQTAKKSAQKAQDDETENLMVERITAHQKAMWMLRSIAKQ